MSGPKVVHILRTLKENKGKKRRELFANPAKQVPAVRHNDRSGVHKTV